MSKYGNAILITEELDFTQVNTRTMQFVDTLCENAGHSMNLIHRNILNGATTGRFAGAVASTGVVVTALDANDIRSAVNTLNNNSAMKFFPMGFGSQNVGTAPIRNSYYGIVHVDVAEDLRQIDGWTDSEQYGGYTQLEPSEIGFLNGVRFIETEVAPINTGGGITSVNGFRGATATANNVYSTFIFGREAHGSVGLGNSFPSSTYMGGDSIPAIEIIQHPPGSSGIADMFDELGSVAWKSHHGGALLNSSWIVKLESLSADIT